MEFDSDEEEFGFFEALFYRDLEKGWNADHFYCDHCYNDFVAEWPLAYSASDAKLQRAGIDLNSFFSGSRLYSEFTMEDYRRLIVQIKCINCRTPLRGGSIWPYHLPFNVPRQFELNVHEISQIAAKAPFLLLAHPFSVEIFDLVKRLFANAPAQPLADRLYRARKTGYQVEKNVATFDFPPAQVVIEGRYNHAGRPVLYVASSLRTCVAEMRNANCLVMEFQLATPIKILDLVNLDDYSGDDYELLGALCYSSLVSAPSAGEGWDRPAYVFTRFFADCATYAGFDAIRYPSTRLGSQDGSFNLVILNRSLSLSSHATSIDYAIHDGAS